MTYDKSNLLKSIEHSLSTGAISTDDLQTLIRKHQTPTASAPTQSAHKRTATTLILNAASVLLVIAILVFVYQTIDTSISRAVAIVLIGLCVWAVRFASSSADNNDLRASINSNVTAIGSSLILYGTYFGSYLVIDTPMNRLSLSILVASVLLTCVFFLYSRLIKEPSLGAITALLLVAIPPSLIHASVNESHIRSEDFWVVVYALVASSITGAGYIAAHFYQKDRRARIRRYFTVTSIVLTLGVIYAGSYVSDFAPLWLLVTPISLAALLYMSILRKRGDFLGISSFFLVLYVLRLSFLLFSGLNVSIALVMTAFVLIGIALGANYINRTYIKR